MRPPLHILVHMALSSGLLASAALPAPAFSQLKPEIQTGSHIATKPKPVDKRDAGIVRKGFGKCTYNADRKAAATFLQHSDLVSIDLESANIKDVGKTFNMEKCLGDEVGEFQTALGFTFSIHTLHAILAEEAYLADRRTAPGLPIGEIEKVDRVYVATGEADPKARVLGEFADCIVFKDTIGSDKVLRTMPGSPDEMMAVRALAPVLGVCLDQGATVSLSATSIRGYVADGLWNRFARPRQAVAAAVVKP